MIGVVLNYLVPSQVFEIVLNIASLGIIASRAFIIVCQMRLRKAVHEGARSRSRSECRARRSPRLTLAFLLIVVVMMAFDYPNGTDHRHHPGAGGAADAGLVRPAQARAGSEIGTAGSRRTKPALIRQTALRGGFYPL